jgi:hypothetical protein
MQAMAEERSGLRPDRSSADLRNMCLDLHQQKPKNSPADRYCSSVVARIARQCV